LGGLETLPRGDGSTRTIHGSQRTQELARARSVPSVNFGLHRIHPGVIDGAVGRRFAVEDLIHLALQLPYANEAVQYLFGRGRIEVG
jgi:hypothetical protein